MDRCNDCGSVLPPTSECLVCATGEESPKTTPDGLLDTGTGVRQSVTVAGSDIKGDITNDAVSGADETREAADQSITVQDSIIDGKLRNRAGAQRIEAKSLVETANYPTRIRTG